ncbi:MAG: TonB-dependent receptor [Bacteroidota bacterium]
MEIFTRQRRPGPVLNSRTMGLLVLLLLSMLPAILFAQTVTVTGTITDESGASMPGVSVLVKGTQTRTATNPSGKYTIKAPNANSTLVFTFIGYTRLEVELKGRIKVDAQLQPVASNLTEVVVVGYGAVKKKDLTGSVGTVNMRDFEKAPVKSFDDALAGRVAGVQVSSNDGQPGSNANIVIRGPGSVTQDNSPLYVIDGFPQETSNANSINPADIESIDVLKDASATAIYGARGSNGVILITTKRGKKGAPQVNYNAYYGIQAIPKKVKLMDPYNFVKYVGELNPAIRDSVYLKNGVTLDDYKNVQALDFQNSIYHTGVNQSHNLSLRGGNDGTQYSISGNYDNQQGIIINSGFKRYQGRFTLDQQVNTKLKVGINVNYAYSESNGIPVSATNFYASATTLYSVWGYRPTTGLSGRDAGTDLLDQFYDPNLVGNSAQDYRVNPLINIQNQLTLVKNNNLAANAYLEYAITKNLTFRTSAGISSNSAETDIFNNSKTQSGSTWNAAGINGSITNVPVTNWLSENALTYKLTIHNNHHLNVLADVSAQGNHSAIRGFSATQVPNEDLGIDGLDLATTYTANSSSSRWTMASALARVNYDYKSKYLATASIRADGSSKFAPGQRWGYFPSASLAWRFSSEDFMKKLSFISDAKLRVSYGASGNNRVSDFAYLPQLQLTNINYWYSAGNGAPAVGSVITSAGNYNLKWETNIQSNIGLDLSLLKDRIGLTVDIYRRTTNDLLLNASLPYAIGIESSTGYENIGKLQNQGLEISLNTTNISTPKFTWSSNFNISFNKNKIQSLTQGQNAILAGSGTFFNTTYTSLFPYISVVGRPLGEMYGLIFDGVYQYSDFDKMPNGSYLLKPNITDNGTTRNTIKPGDVKYKDLNGDLTVNNKDYTIIGHGLPASTGGFSNNFRFHQFDLNVLLQWSYGNDIINANRIAFEGGVVVNPNLNQFASYENRWEPDNPSNTLFRAGGGGNAAYSSRVVEDGSYLKLRTVSLGYSLPKSLLTRLKVQNVRIYASAQNILTFTGYSGQDPEVSARNSTLTPGFDYTAYPHSLTVVMGLNATF